MHRIAVTPRAYRAIKATLPAGSIVYLPDRNARGQYLLWLTETEANRLAALRRRGESYSEAVIRLAKAAQDRRGGVADSDRRRTERRLNRY